MTNSSCCRSRASKSCTKIHLWFVIPGLSSCLDVPRDVPLGAPAIEAPAASAASYHELRTRTPGVFNPRVAPVATIIHARQHQRAPGMHMDSHRIDILAVGFS